MEFITITQKTNQLLNKQEIKAEVVFDGPTPARNLIKKEFAKKNKLDPAKIVLKKISNIFGEKKIIITVDVYKDEKSLKNANKVYLQRDAKKKTDNEEGKSEKITEKPEKNAPKETTVKQDE